MELNILHSDIALGKVMPTDVELFVATFNLAMLDPDYVKAGQNHAAHDNRFWEFVMLSHFPEDIQRNIRQIVLAGGWGAVTFTCEIGNVQRTTLVRVFQNPIRL